MDSPAEKIYGGCEGSGSMYVKLIASDGHELIIKRELALKSKIIECMLGYPYFTEHDEEVVILRDIPSRDLVNVCKFLSYKNAYTSLMDDVPDFVIAKCDAKPLLMAANFLEV